MIANDYKTPTADQVSIGIAQQLGSRMSVQMDYVHSQGLQRAARAAASTSSRIRSRTCRSIRTRARRPYPQYNEITRYETTAASDYDGWQFGFQGRQHRPRVGANGSVGQLHAVVDRTATTRATASTA